MTRYREAFADRKTSQATLQVTEGGPLITLGACIILTHVISFYRRDWEGRTEAPALLRICKPRRRYLYQHCHAWNCLPIKAGWIHFPTPPHPHRATRRPRPIFNRRLGVGLRHFKVYGDKLQPSSGESEDRCSRGKLEIAKATGMPCIQVWLNVVLSNQRGFTAVKELQNENAHILKWVLLSAWLLLTFK